jgi:hypothetical protein
MVNPKFVSNAMREMDSRFFVIEDAAGNVMYHQWQNIALDQAIERFENFVKNCSANSSFVVNVYQSNERLRNGEPTAKNQGMRYEVWVDNAPSVAPQDNNPQGFAGINGINNIAESMLNVGRMGSVDLHTYLSTKDEIMQLRLKIQQLEMENRYLQDRHNGEIDRVKREYEEKLSSDRKIEGIIGSVLPAMGLGGGMAGINGIGSVAEPEQVTAKERVLKAVNVLLKNDPDFPENITKLAELVVKNKTIYQMAVKQLNSL